LYPAQSSPTRQHGINVQAQDFGIVDIPRVQILRILRIFDDLRIKGFCDWEASLTQILLKRNIRTLGIFGIQNSKDSLLVRLTGSYPGAVAGSISAK
jgi:hypothetical protein